MTKLFDLVRILSRFGVQVYYSKRLTSSLHANRSCASSPTNYASVFLVFLSFYAPGTSIPTTLFQRVPVILFNKRFNKIAIQGTPQMAVEKEAISLSRVYSYDSKRTCRYSMCSPP